MKHTRIRVLSYNIHKGFTTGNFKFILHQIREAVHLVNADIVFLQEVVGRHSAHEGRISNWPKEPQFEFLAGKLWPHFAYGKNAIYDEGHHGNVILSRFPFASWENINISSSRYEQRGILHGQIESAHHHEPVHVACTHLSLLERSRQKQVEALCKRFAPTVPKQAPVILAGDFNDWGLKITPVLKKKLGLEECYKIHHGSHAKTFPAFFPWFSLDRIYFRGFKVNDVMCLTGEPWKFLSDHAALYADLELMPDR